MNTVTVSVEKNSAPSGPWREFWASFSANRGAVIGFWIALGGTFLAGWLILRVGMTSSFLIGTVAGSQRVGNSFW